MAHPDEPDPAEGANPKLPAAFETFRIETEAMPDGRSIHYYSWPAQDDETSPDASPADV